MSQFENDETLDETTTEVVEETAEAEAVENESENNAEAEAGEPKAEEKAAEQTDANDVLFDKANKAARLLRCRRAVMRREQEEKGGKASALVRALKLLQLKPKMEQKEMSELLGMRLRELDAMMAEAEKNDIVARVEPAEPDMRKVVIMADEGAIERAEAFERKGEDLVPGLGEDDMAQLNALLDKVIDPLVALGLDEDREERGGFGAKRDDRGGRGGFGGRDRGGDRGGRGGFGGRDSRGGDRGGFRGNDRGGDRGGFRGGNDRGGFGGRDSRGGDRGGFRGNDRGGDRGGFRGGNDRGGFRGGSDRGGFRGNDRGGDRGGYRGGNDRGGYRGGSDRGNDRGGYRGGNRY